MNPCVHGSLLLMCMSVSMLRTFVDDLQTSYLKVCIKYKFLVSIYFKTWMSTENCRAKGKENGNILWTLVFAFWRHETGINVGMMVWVSLPPIFSIFYRVVRCCSNYKSEPYISLSLAISYSSSTSSKFLEASNAGDISQHAIFYISSKAALARIMLIM